MRVLILGAGGRESALAWLLSQSDKVLSVDVWPASSAVSLVHPSKVRAWPSSELNGPWDLVIVGSEAYLINGVAQGLRDKAYRVLGPSPEAAQMECSKQFAKNVMKEAQVLFAKSESFTKQDQARFEEYLKKTPPPWVLKKNGLAGGKGVVITSDAKQALSTAYEFWSDPSDSFFLVEEFLSGVEVSAFALCQDEDFIFLGTATDYKRRYDADQGPNTGGMGALSPSPFVTRDEEVEIGEKIFRPVLKTLKQKGVPYEGFLYAGLMKTAEGFRVLEFNARLGDPETQALVSLWNPDVFVELLQAFLRRELRQAQTWESSLRKSRQKSVHVVLCQGPYPEAVGAGEAISWTSWESGFFPAGVSVDSGRYVAKGGRVFGVTGTATSWQEARALAYEKVPSIHFAAKDYRRDIGLTPAQAVRVVVFASGRGSNAESLVRSFGVTQKRFSVVALLTDNPQAEVVQKAQSWGLPCYVIPWEGDRQAHECSVIECLNQLSFDLIVLAGYRRLLSSFFLGHFPPYSVVNIHPSLLPQFPGLHAYERAWAEGIQEHGFSVHFVDEEMDHGPMIEQFKWEVRDIPTLEEFMREGLRRENLEFPRILQHLLEKTWCYRIEIYPRELKSQQPPHLVRVIELKSSHPMAQLRTIAHEVLSDPVLEKVFITSDSSLSPMEMAWKTKYHCWEVSYRPGVTDTTASVVREILSHHPKLRAQDLQVQVSQRYWLPEGSLPSFNTLIQYVREGSLDPGRFAHLPSVLEAQAGVTQLRSGTFEVLKIRQLGEDDLQSLNEKKLWALNREELKVIQQFFKDLGRDPTDVEMECLAQTWSEHCKHKIFRATIDYRSPQGQTRIDSLFKTYIKGLTEQVARQRNLHWLVSVFDDNAGIIRWSDKIDICVKAETHNSPSALEPYGGALTGVLGVQRDILGTGLGAEPIAHWDVLCFPADVNPELYYPEAIAPETLREGVHRGIQDAGNKTGVPTVTGAFYYHPSYAAKPLVFCGCLGVLPPQLPGGESAKKQTRAGDLIFMVGGRIGKDGIHGATFSSLALTQDIPQSVVQLGDPFLQKRMTDFVLAARDRGLYSGITDNGAGGLSSSVGEMALWTNGARVDLSRAPLKYPGLKAFEILVSESQERMTVSVPPEKKQAFMDLADQFGVEVSELGVFLDHGRFEVFYGEHRVLDLPLEFLHHACPKAVFPAQFVGESDMPEAEWQKRSWLPSQEDLHSALLTRLVQPHVRSHETWVRRFDHEVKAHVHKKPFGYQGGPGDGSVLGLRPWGEERIGVALGVGLAPHISEQDAYVSAVYAGDEALRNVLVSGGNPHKVAMLDNFCWPDPLPSAKNPDHHRKMGALVRSAQGLFDILVSYGIPLVSGKDSMKNDAWLTDPRTQQKTKVSVLPTLMVTAVTCHEKPDQVLTPRWKEGQSLWVLGYPRAGEPALFGEDGQRRYPVYDFKTVFSDYERFYEGYLNGFIQSAHDVSDGGILVAVAEMFLSSPCGAELEPLAAPFAEGMGLIVFSTDRSPQEVQNHFARVRYLGVTGGPDLKLGNIRWSRDQIQQAYCGGPHPQGGQYV